MMTQDELRIGNLILDAIGGVCEVRGITKEGIWIRDNGGVGSIELFNPIELTEEWLEKFGFEIAEDVWWWKELRKMNMDYRLEFLSLVPYDNDFEVELNMTFKGKYSPEDPNIQNCYEIGWIKYVHGLQNLYFALCGKELEIKK